jgi:hypothetical protein
MTHTTRDKPLHSYETAASPLSPDGSGAPESRLQRLRELIYDFLLGATLSWVLVPFQIRKRREMERMISLLFSAQMMGMPLLPASARLRLQPYLMPSLMYWRRITVFDRAIEGADLRHIGH